MGPAIRACCYEVDKYCALPFIKKSLGSSGFVIKTSREKYFLDLPKANRLEGLEAGVLRGNIFADGPCTSCNNHKWYSYRKEGTCFRNVALVMLR